MDITTLPKSVARELVNSGLKPARAQAITNHYAPLLRTLVDHEQLHTMPGLEYYRLAHELTCITGDVMQ